MASSCQHDLNDKTFATQFLLIMHLYTTVYNISLGDTYKSDVQQFLSLAVEDAKDYHNTVYTEYPNLSENQKVILKTLSFTLYRMSKERFELGKTLLPPKGSSATPVKL
jgi:hypothetical protein